MHLRQRPGKYIFNLNNIIMKKEDNTFMLTLTLVNVMLILLFYLVFSYIWWDFTKMYHLMINAEFNNLNRVIALVSTVSFELICIKITDEIDSTTM